MWEAEAVPGRGQCERSQHPRGRGSIKEELVPVGEGSASVKGHIDQHPEGEGSGWGTGSTKLKGQCSGGEQCDGVNAGLKRGSGRE